MEKKIMEYLGVDDFKNVKQLENYTVTFHNGNYFEVEDDKKKVEPNFEIEGGYEFKKDNNMIIALLEKQNQNRNKQKELDNKQKNMRGKYFPFDTGHLLGVSLIKYLKICNDPEKDISTKKKLIACPNNLIPQFSYANRIIQHDFEEEVSRFIDNNSNAKVFYEIEAIYNNNLNELRLPIGTRIFATYMGNHDRINKALSSKIKMPFHVFIPNYQVIANCENQRSWYCFGLDNLKIDTRKLYERKEYFNCYRKLQENIKVYKVR